MDNENMIKHNTMNIKKMNKKKIFDYLYASEPLSKQQIAYALEMSIPTVAQNIKELQSAGLIKDAGMFASTGGRKAQALECNAKAKFAIGLDVTRNHISCVVVDLRGDLLCTKRIRLLFSNTQQYYKSIGKLVEELIEETNIDRRRILGVGVAVPAIVSEDGQIMTYSSVLGMDRGYLKSFAQYIDYSCTLYNDANSAGFAEVWNFGDAAEDVVYVSLNNTVGASTIRNNTVSQGTNQRAGEIGHMTIVTNGDYCYCGQQGCMDVYCNAKLLSEKTDGNLDLFFAYLKNGDHEYRQIWDTYLNHLAVGVNNLRMVFDCDIIIGGYVGGFMDAYIGELRNLLAEKNTFAKDGNYVRVCNFRNEATAVGAALHYIDSYIKSI